MQYVRCSIHRFGLALHQKTFQMQRNIETDEEKESWISSKLDLMMMIMVSLQCIVTDYESTLVILIDNQIVNSMVVMIQNMSPTGMWCAALITLLMAIYPRAGLLMS